MRMPKNGMCGQWVRRDGSVQPFSFAFAEGCERITVFWRVEPSRFFAQLTNIIHSGY